jgi:hypothetical protein
MQTKTPSIPKGPAVVGVVTKRKNSNTIAAIIPDTINVLANIYSTIPHFKKKEPERQTICDGRDIRR